MIYPDTPLHGHQHLEKQAVRVALLAFRCARHDEHRRDVACGLALKAYLDILPDDPNATDRVIDAIADAVGRHPHWVA